LVAIEFTHEEIDALLWHIAVIDTAYGVSHPAFAIADSAYKKLLKEYQNSLPDRIGS
jgi:hypothetical protein